MDRRRHGTGHIPSAPLAHALAERPHLAVVAERVVAVRAVRRVGGPIFPGILTVIPEHPWVGLAAGAVAVALALVQKQILVVVAGAVMTVYVAQLFLT